MNHTLFLKKARALLGAGAVEAPRRRTALGGFARDGVGRLIPRTQAQAAAVVRLAGRCGAALHPISAGKNWGLGSELPWRKNTFILDLGLLNRILEVNDELGYAVVEPGVTQIQLAKHLTAMGSRFYLDVTGSGTATSVMGSSLERGIAYNHLRAEVTGPLKVLLPDGRITHTGFSPEPAGPLRHVYPYGVGPDTNGLFYQSSFGVVLEMTVRLVPKGESQQSFAVNFDNADLPRFLAICRGLLEQNVFHGITHVSSRRRTLTSLGPVIYQNLDKRGAAAAGEVTKLINRFFPKDWTAFGFLHGHKALVNAQKQIFREHLSPLGTVRFPSPRITDAARRVAGRLKLFSYEAVLAAIQEFAGLTAGQPTDAALASTRVLGDRIDVPAGVDPERKTGFLYFLPILPFNQASIAQLGKLLEPHLKEVEVTLNILNPRLLEAVISVNFDQADQKAESKAYDKMRLLDALFGAKGFLPYRANVNGNFRARPLSQDLAKRLKKFIDPRNTLSPGRYGLSK